jgi:P pilus assembly chaperone PapD
MIPLLLIVAFSAVSYAATVSVTPFTYQDYEGIHFIVTGALTGSFNGFFVVTNTQTASILPCTWANGGTCNTALTAGHWYLSITLTTTSTALAPGPTYTVTVKWAPNTNSPYTTLTALTFQTGATPPQSGESMTFLFDTGVSTFYAPAGIVVTVA